MDKCCFSESNKENQQPQGDRQNNSEEGINEGSNVAGDVPQVQRQQNGVTITEQVNQSSTTDDSRQ